MRATLIVLGLVACSGCGAVVEPGHRALFFDPREKGLHHEVLGPGYYHVGTYGRLDDFDVTYSTKKEAIRTTSADDLQLDVKLAVIFRPIVSEIYELDTEIGPNYYDEVVGPECRSAARGVFARHHYADLQKHNEKIEDEIEADLRRRIQGKHVEISSITMEAIDYAPEIAAANRARLVGEQEAIRQKAALEAEALRAKLGLQIQAEQEKLKADAAVREKQSQRLIAEEDAKLQKVEAEVAIVRARAEAEQRTVLAKATAEEKKAEAKSVTWFEVQMHAYDALGRLGGENTHILIGDWAKLPNFLLLPNAGATGGPALPPVRPTGYTVPAPAAPASAGGPNKPIVLKRAPKDP